MLHVTQRDLKRCTYLKEMSDDFVMILVFIYLRSDMTEVKLGWVRYMSGLWSRSRGRSWSQGSGSVEIKLKNHLVIEFRLIKGSEIILG